MSTKTIRKRIKQVVMGTVISGATVFTVPMTGCENAAKEEAAARFFYGFVDESGVIRAFDKGILHGKGAVRNRGVVIR